jgi:predicted MFS family arabinose efflux permease
VEQVVLLGLGLAAFALLALCLTPWLDGAMAAALLLFILAALTAMPALLTLFTARFALGHRAQAQALAIAAANVSFALAAPFFSRVLFDPRAHGPRAALPFAVGLICVLGGVLVARRTFAAELPTPPLVRQLPPELEALQSLRESG